MELKVNGKAHSHRGKGGVADLLKELHADPKRVALMVNGEISPRAKWNLVKLTEGDTVELLVFAGGG